MNIVVSNLHVKGTYVLKARAVSCTPPLLRHVVPFNDGNCRLTIPVIKGCCACEALPHAFYIWVFKYGKSNPTKIKHIYNKSENLNESCDVAFDSSNWWNLSWTVPVIGVESMVTRAGLRYTDYLTPGICSLIKPAAMEKLMSSFRAKIHTVMLWIWTKPLHKPMLTYVSWTCRNKLQLNLNKNTIIFIQQNIFENVICKMAAVLLKDRTFH